MKTKLTKLPVEQVTAAIQALDLDPIKLKLMNPEEGHGWSREYADRMEVAYKRFLTLSVTHPEETLAPSKDVDRFWHGHILDTLKYAEDCDKAFGCFLHHFPYFGMRGAEDAANLAAAAENMKRLYQQDFGSVQNCDAGGSGGTTKAENATYSAAIKAEGAYCAAIQADDVAYCAAIKAEGAYCAAIQADDVAYCAAVKAEGAYCAAIRRMSAKLDVSVRPSLPASA